MRRLLVEKVVEKFDDVLASSGGRLGVIGDRNSTFDTQVVESGGLARIAISGIHGPNEGKGA